MRREKPNEKSRTKEIGMEDGYHQNITILKLLLGGIVAIEVTVLH